MVAQSWGGKTAYILSKQELENIIFRPFGSMLIEYRIFYRYENTFQWYQYRKLECLFNIFFTNKKRNIKARHDWPFVRGIHRWPVDSPHKGPVMRKACPWHDTVMFLSVMFLFAQPFVQAQIKETSKVRATGLSEGIHRWPVDSPHKSPVTWKFFHLMTS